MKNYEKKNLLSRQENPQITVFFFFFSFPLYFILSANKQTTRFKKTKLTFVIKIKTHPCPCERNGKKASLHLVGFCRMRETLVLASHLFKFNKQTISISFLTKNYKNQIKNNEKNKRKRIIRLGFRYLI